MIMKKLLFIIPVLLATFLLTGCGTPNLDYGTSQQVSESQPQSTPLELNITPEYL